MIERIGDNFYQNSNKVVNEKLKQIHNEFITTRSDDRAVYAAMKLF